MMKKKEKETLEACGFTDTDNEVSDLTKFIDELVVKKVAYNEKLNELRTTSSSMDDVLERIKLVGKIEMLDEIILRLEFKEIELGNVKRGGF